MPENSWIRAFRGGTESLDPLRVVIEDLEANMRVYDHAPDALDLDSYGTWSTTPIADPVRATPVARCSAEGCGRMLTQSEICFQHDGSPVCNEHYVRMTRCRGCRQYGESDSMQYVEHRGFSAPLCESCYAVQTASCGDCGSINFIGGGGGSDFVCRPCMRVRMVSCVSCGDGMNRSTAVVSRNLGGFSCPSCLDLYSREVVTYEVLNGEVRPSLPFGIEIEAEFGYGGCPFELYGYHSHEGATSEFIYGWRAETDSSLHDGGEFISPPLNGMEGMAEVLWTYRMLRDSGARINTRCGQHISLTNFVPRSDFAPKVQLLTMALEEALFAVGGDLERCMHNRYCVRLKEHDTEGLFNKRFNEERRVPAYIKGRDVVEFRYPPGTLTATDLCINLGLTQMVMEEAKTIEEDVLEALARECLDASNIHDRVMVGLRFISSRGWYPGSQFDGLPYNPHVHTEVAFRDNVNGHNDVVVYPTASEIMDRMVDNIERFYRFGMTGHFTTGNRDEAIREILG